MNDNCRRLDILLGGHPELKGKFIGYKVDRGGMGVSRIDNDWYECDAYLINADDVSEYLTTAQAEIAEMTAQVERLEGEKLRETKRADAWVSEVAELITRLGMEPSHYTTRYLKQIEARADTLAAENKVLREAYNEGVEAAAKEFIRLVMSGTGICLDKKEGAKAIRKLKRGE